MFFNNFIFLKFINSILELLINIKYFNLGRLINDSGSLLLLIFVLIIEHSFILYGVFFSNPIFSTFDKINFSKLNNFRINGFSKI